MYQFAVNLSTIFTEAPFLERFRKARAHGFSYVECQFPYVNSIEEIQKELVEHQLSMVLFNLLPGNWSQGDRGLAAIKNRKQEFQKSVEQGIEYATALNVKKIHCMAGIVSETDRREARKVFQENLFMAGTLMAKNNLTLLIEPINQYDMPGYFLDDLHLAAEILDEVNVPNVRLQFDFYHIERIHGNALSLYRKYQDLIGHLQLADVPGRHQPGTGKMNYREILHFLHEAYEGDVGLEYTPSGESESSFKWLKEIGG